MPADPASAPAVAVPFSEDTEEQKRSAWERLRDAVRHKAAEHAGRAGAGSAEEWDARVRFRKLQLIREPGRPPIVGCEAVKAFMEVDEDGLLALNALVAFPCLREAHAFLLTKHGLDLDLPDFVRHLVQRGFVWQVNDIIVSNRQVDKRQRTFLGNVPARAVAWMHAPATLAVWGALVLAAVAAAVHDPGASPNYRDVRILPHSGLILLAAFAFMGANAYVHELAHLLMARGFGIASSISVSRRFHIVVLQTDVTNAWTLPRRRDRCLVFLAGMGYNAAFLSACVLLVAADRSGALHLGAETVRLLRFAAFMNTIPLHFQLLVWIRTDLYYVLMTALGHRALQSDSRRLLAFLRRRAGLAAMGYPRVRCACGGRLFLGERLCLRCGRHERSPDDSQMPFQRDALPMLLAFGLVSAVVLPAFLVLAVAGGVFGSLVALLREAFVLRFHLAAGHAALALDDAVVLLARFLRLFMVVGFALPALVRRLFGLVARWPAIWAGALLFAAAAWTRIEGLGRRAPAAPSPAAAAVAAREGEPVA